VEEKSDFEKTQEEQEQIATLSTDPRWELIEKMIEQRIDFLKQMIDPLSGSEIISGDETVETVGFKYLIVSAIIKYLNEIKNLPKMFNEQQQQQK
jgi:hypothetical protein